MTKSIKNSYYYQNHTSLTKEEIVFFKNELENKKIKIQKSLHITEKELNSSTNDSPKDEGDYASQSVGNSANNAIIIEQNKTLTQINRSLNRIATGRYGICNLCEETINIERLKAKIFAEYCITCKEILEKKREY